MQSPDKVIFKNADGELLAGRIERPTGEPLAHALFAHCFTCSKDIAAATRISRALRDRGFAVLRFDFTGLGNSEGDFANTDFTSNVQDVVAAADHLRETAEAPKLFVGHSLGGAAVLMAAAQVPEARAVATIGAPADPGHVRDLLRDDVPVIERQGWATVELGGRRFRLSKAFLDDLERQRPEEVLGNLRAALMICHAPLDNIVSIDHARRIFEAARHPKSFLSLDDADHLVSRKQDADYVAHVLAAWASRYVGEPPAPEAPEGRVVVEETGDHLANRILAGRHVLTADEPEPVGGGDAGPTPYDLLLASLGACTSMTLRLYADRKKWPLDKVSVRLSHGRIHAEDCDDCETKEGFVDQLERHISVTGDLDDDQRARLLEIANKCPVHRTLLNEKRMPTTLDRASRD